MAETPLQSIVDWPEFRDFAAVDPEQILRPYLGTGIGNDGDRHEVRAEFGVVVLDAKRPILRLQRVLSQRG